MRYEITTKYVEPQPSLTIRVTAPADMLGAMMGETLPEVWTYAMSQGAHPAGPPFALYHHFASDAVDFESGMPFTAKIEGQGRIQASQLPGGKVASTWHVGPYDTLTQAYRALEAWMETEGVAMAGPPWEVYWTDPGEVPNPAEWRTEVLWPIK